MTTARVVETSFTVNENSPIQDYVHLDDHAAIMLYLLIMKLRLTPLFKPFTLSQHTIYWVRNKKRITIYKLLHHLPGHLFSQYKALKPVKDIFPSDLNITNISFDEELIPPLGGVSP